MIHRPYPSLPAFSLADKKKPSIEGLKRPLSLSTKQGDQSSVKMREEYTSYVFLYDDGGGGDRASYSCILFDGGCLIFVPLFSLFPPRGIPSSQSQSRSQCVVRSLAHFLPLIESLDSSDLN